MPSLVQRSLLPRNLSVPRVGTVPNGSLSALLSAEGVAAAFIAEGGRRDGDDGWRWANRKDGNPAKDATPINVAPSFDPDCDGNGHAGFRFDGTPGGLTFDFDASESYAFMMAIRPTDTETLFASLVGTVSNPVNQAIFGAVKRDGAGNFLYSGKHQITGGFAATTASVMPADAVSILFQSFDAVAEILTVGIGNGLSTVSNGGPGGAGNPPPAFVTSTWHLGGPGSGVTFTGDILAAAFWKQTIYSPLAADPINAYRTDMVSFMANGTGATV